MKTSLTESMSTPASTPSSYKPGSNGSEQPEGSESGKNEDGLRSVKRISNDDLFQRSSQYKHWTLTEGKLESMRNYLNVEIQRKFKETNNEIKDEDIKQYISEDFEPLSVKEQYLLVKYYLGKANDLGLFFKLPLQVRLTCISYMTRFFLIKSPLEYDIQGIMYTSLFLACKSEDKLIPIEQFCKSIPKVTVEGVLKYEWDLLVAMKFTLLCHHGNRPLYGFYLDIQRTLPKLDIGRLGSCYDVSRNWLIEAQMSDAMLLYTPSQIAMACIWISDDVVFERYLERRFEKEKGERIMTIVKKCAGVIKCSNNSNNKLSVESAKAVAIKMHFYLDPKKYFKKVKKVKLSSVKRGNEQLELKEEEKGGDFKRAK